MHVCGVTRAFALRITNYENVERINDLPHTLMICAGAVYYFLKIIGCLQNETFNSLTACVVATVGIQIRPKDFGPEM